MKKEQIFQTNPSKAANKLTINSFMMGSTFFIFTLIWTLNPEKFSYLIIAQIVMSIPLLYVSSLAYSKIAYWKETRLWDSFGWFTNNLANIMLLNVIGLMVSQMFRPMALLYFGLIIFLMLIYSAINVIYSKHTFKQKLFKFLFLVVGLLIGGILPILGLY
jgi:hypothetical protein